MERTPGETKSVCRAGTTEPQKYKGRRKKAPALGQGPVKWLFAVNELINAR
jgi:hypothetical protein